MKTNRIRVNYDVYAMRSGRTQTVRMLDEVNKSRRQA